MTTLAEHLAERRGADATAVGALITAVAEAGIRIADELARAS